ncbi:MAG: outer membrane protein transport protein [Helicobacteraceae bacterium]|jgi:long-chain fatty acid transport protein|nr:outer membrane protein transport protein [Helicobacteraceae bacterium]
MHTNGKLLMLMLAASTTSIAGGYKLTTSSLNGTALSSANVANAHGADAAYYNPANMSFNGKNNDFELDLTYIGLPPIDYTSSSGTTISSESESAVIPTLHYVSQPFGRVRVGLSVVTPAGLTKRWEDQPARFYANEYSLKAVELNPTLAVAISENLSVAAGIRFVYSKATAKGDGDGLPTSNPYSTISREMEGDSIDTGYNLALSYHPLDSLSFAATYRSKINLTLEGEASVDIDTYHADTAGSVESMLPAALVLAAAYHFEKDTTLEFLYERTFWSANKSLDFEYDDAVVESVLGAPIEKNWNDTSTYRLGLTQKYTNWSVMAGTFYDETPAPDATLGYDSPDADSYGFSLGGRYQLGQEWSLGLSGLYLTKKDRTVTAPPNSSGIDGEFTNSKAYIVTTGISYSF